MRIVPMLTGILAVLVATRAHAEQLYTYLPHQKLICKGDSVPGATAPAKEHVASVIAPITANINEWSDERIARELLDKVMDDMIGHCRAKGAHSTSGFVITHLPKKGSGYPVTAMATVRMNGEERKWRIDVSLGGRAGQVKRAKFFGRTRHRRPCHEMPVELVVGIDVSAIGKRCAPGAIE